MTPALHGHISSSRTARELILAGVLAGEGISLGSPGIGFGRISQSASLANVSVTGHLGLDDRQTNTHAFCLKTTTWSAEAVGDLIAVVNLRMIYPMALREREQEAGGCSVFLSSASGLLPSRTRAAEAPVPDTVDEQLEYFLSQLTAAERQEFARFVGDIQTPFSFDAVEYMEEEDSDGDGADRGDTT